MGTRTMLRLAVGICIVSAVTAQYNSLQRGPDKDAGRYRPQYSNNFQTTTPAPSDPSKFAKIMKQINKVNDDGSYTFGFENDDGSFRVETRTKDGLVKGKYGFVDANGQLKVTEYTAGEKSEEPEDSQADISESEEEAGGFRRPRPSAARPLPLSARPQSRVYNPQPQQPQFPQYIPRQLPLDSRPIASATPAPYRTGNRGAAFDQAPAAQTAQEKVARAPPTSDDDFRETSDEDGDSFSKRQSGSQEDNLNGQYFRSSVSPGAGGAAPGNRGRFPGSGGGNAGSGGRPLYGGAGGPAAYAQQYPGAFSPAQGGQYNYGVGGPQGFQGGPGGPQAYQGGIGGPQGFPGGAPQFDIPTGFVGSQGFAPAFPQQGGPQGFRRLNGSPQDFSSIGNLQGRGSPQGQRSPQNLQSIQTFGGFGGFNPRQGPSGAGGKGSGETPSGEQYIPSVELDGYSEDLDQDGYPDEPPKDGKVALKSGGPGSGGASPNYRAVTLGPQGGPQGGFQSPRGQGPSPGVSPQGQIILQLGPQGNVPQGAFGGGRFPGPQQQQGGQGGGGLPPHYTPQQSFGGFPQGGVQGGFPQGAYPQGFPQGFEGGAHGFPQQFAPQGGRGGQYNGALQGGGFPYDYSPVGGAQGFQGFPAGAEGLPFGEVGQTAPYPQQLNYPGAQNYGGFPGSAGGPQGFPSGGPNRFSSGGSGSNGAQSFLSGGQYGNLSGLGQSSPTPGGASSSPSSAEAKKP